MKGIRVVGFMLTLPLAVPLSQRTTAQEATEPRVAALVRNLGASDYATRHAADLELLALGDESLRQLQLAAKSDDLEVRLRANNLLERIAVARLWEPAKVSLAVKDESLGKVLAECARQSGNRVCAGDPYGEFLNTQISLACQKQSYWQLLDQLTAQTGNTLRAHYDSRLPGIVVVKGKPGHFPTAYAGPLRVQITSAKRAHSEHLDFEAITSDVSHSFQLNLQMMWEDRVQLAAYATQPEVVSARTDAGQELAVPQHSFSGWNVPTGNTRQIAATIKLLPPNSQAGKLSSLKLKWPLIAFGEMETVEIKPLADNGTVENDAIAVQITSLSRQSTGRVELTLLVARNLPIPDPPDILFQENTIELLDAQGRPLRMQNQFHSLGERGVEFRLAFAADSADQAPHQLRVSYPKIRSRRDVEIVFTDVPLPVARPE